MSDSSLVRTSPGALPRHLITQPAELQESLAELGKTFHVLSPAMAISQLAEGYGANLAIVSIDARVDSFGKGTDTYYSPGFMKRRDDRNPEADERALSKLGLLKIARAAGIDWHPNLCRRVDDGRVRNLWRWQHLGLYRSHDGSVGSLPGSKELDLRDGSPQIGEWTPAKWAALQAENEAKLSKAKNKAEREVIWQGLEKSIGGWSDKRVMQARASGNQICESKSMLNAIRNMGVKGSYTVGELKKAFLVVRFTFTPDMRDASIKRLVTAAHLGGISSLYAGAGAPMLEAPADLADLPELEGEVVNDPEGATTAATTGPAATSAPAADKPAPEPVDEDLEIPEAGGDPIQEATFQAPKAKKVLEVLKHTGADKVVAYSVRFDDDGTCWTESVEIAQAAARAKKGATPVIITTAAGKEGRCELLEMQTATAAAAAERPEGTRIVVNVAEASGPTKAGGKWVRFDVTFEDGQVASTFNGTIAAEAAKAKAETLPVRVDVSASDKYPDRFDLNSLTIVDPRQGDLLAAGEEGKY